MSFDLQWKEEHADDSVEVDAVIEGPTDRSGLLDEILANAPAAIGTLVFNRITSMSLITGTTDVWTVTLRYAAVRAKQERKAFESEFFFSTAKRTFTRTFSISSRVYDADGPNENYPDARIIGWNEQERRAEGIQKTEILDAFGWRATVPFSLATDSWRRQVGSYRNTVCSQSFFGYPPGEVLFDDVSGQVTGGDTFTFDMRFLRGPNPGTVNIGGINVPDLKFWEDLDIDDQELVEENGIIVPKVRRVKVHINEPRNSWFLLKSFLGV